MKRKTMAQTIVRQKIAGVKHFQKPLFCHDSWLGLGPVALSSKHMIIKKETSFKPGRFHGITGNAGNHGKDWKLHKSNQILNQTKRNINKLCLGKISLEKTLRIKFSVDSRFSNEFYGKKRKPGNAGNQQKAF